MNWFRERASGIAAPLLLTVATLIGSLSLPHAADCVDADDGVILVVHDATAHRIGGHAPIDPQPDHCLFCHWARSFRPHIETKFVPAQAADAGVKIHADFLTVARTTAVAQPSLRSPPAAPALS